MSLEFDTLLPQWGFSSEVPYTSCSNGVDNYTYRIEAPEQPYILAALRTASTHRLEQIIALINWLKSCELPVAPTLTTLSGAPYLMCGDYPVVVQHCLPGASTKQPNSKQCESAGRILGHFHQCTQHLQALQNLEAEDWKSHTCALLKSYAHTMSEPELELQQQLISMKLAEDFPEGVLHNDFFCDNLLFAVQEHKLTHHCTGLIDFYCMTRGYLLRDIAIALIDWAWDPQTKQYLAPLVRSFLDGYQTQRLLSAQEKQALPDFTLFAAGSIWAYRLERLERGDSLSPNRSPADMINRLQALQDISAFS
ncbi:MAG: phosphotransferase [Gammaproteobacteria bacterium]